jgi:pimeloyl-ACP methyl ester carboxylesterase
VNIIVNDLLIHYELKGRGRLVLLLHGWGDNLRGLKNLQDELAKDYQVLAVDLPGFGASQAPPIAWDLDNYATFLRDFLAKLDVAKLYAVVGHSNGGALALRAIGTDRFELAKLVVIAASGIRNSQKLRRTGLKVLAKTGNAATFWLPEKHRRGLQKRLYGVAGSDMLVVPQLQETFKRTVRQDVQADAAKVEQPTLLIYASDDRAVPLADGRRYHQLIKNSTLEVIEEAGHFVHLDQPARVLALIKDFLA